MVSSLPASVHLDLSFISMSTIQSNEPAEGNGDGGGGGWVVVKHDWWRTPLGAVSWAYTPSAKDGRPVAKPPIYSASLSEHISQSPAPSAQDGADSDSMQPRLYEQDILLNSDLVGVKGAGEVVAEYETDVGFHVHPTLDLIPSSHKASSPLRYEADEDDVALNRELWAELVQNITGGLSLEDFSTDGEESPTAPCFSDFSPILSSERGLHSSTSTLSSIDVPEPYNFMPYTPKPKADVPLVSTPSRRLNASASAFVPSSLLPESSSPLFSFTFPSLGKPVPALPTVKITKDDQGFVTEVQVESESVPARSASSTSSSRPSSALLPPFLSEPCHRRRAPSSKTRALVDQLRLTQPRDDFSVSSIKAKSLSPSPSPSYDGDFFKPRLSVSEDGGDRDSLGSSEADDDGWIGISEADADDEVQTKRKKAQRTLFLALSRHRGESVGVLSDSGQSDEPSVIVPRVASPLLSPPLPSPAPSSHDGWIDGSSLSIPSVTPAPTVSVTTRKERYHPRRPVHARKPSTAPSATSLSPPNSAPSSVTSFAVPPLHAPPFPLHPHAHPALVVPGYGVPVPVAVPPYMYPGAAAYLPNYAYMQMAQMRMQQQQLRAQTGGQAAAAGGKGRPPAHLAGGSSAAKSSTCPQHPLSHLPILHLFA
ncbi:hypothetical protein HGRIS_001844 [Hohenbuehelia grisea]|uniref:Uncharacterized protein n=1 Tax=Hohenbuehelia grisea TaxID=104357 RepID=A0ABR3JIM2_9AGAR